MKRSLIIVAALVCLAGIAVAANNAGSLSVQDKAQLNGQQLTAGDYKVQWEGTGATAQVKVLLGKKAIVTTTATLKEMDKAAGQDSVTYRTSANGNQIAEIQFRGKKTFLVFEPATPAGN